MSIRHLTPVAKGENSDKGNLCDGTKAISRTVTPTSQEAGLLNEGRGPSSATLCIVARCQTSAEGGRGNGEEKAGDKAPTMPANGERKGMKIC